MVAPDDQGVEAPTRERLLDAGMELVAERGYRATTVGDIELAAGLKPRRGALYKHFTSKELLLQAAVERHLDAVERARRAMDGSPRSDLRTVVDALGRWLLAELDAERAVTQVLEKEGDRLPELRDRFREQVSDAGYRATSELLGRFLDGSRVDLDALAVIVLSPLINLRRSTWLYSEPPLAIDDEQMLAAWVDSCERLVSSHLDP